MQPSLPIPELLQQLSAFATTIAGNLSGNEIDWTWRPDPASWSLGEVMCHLRDVEKEVHAVRYKAVVAEENPFLPGAATDEWATIRCYEEQDGPTARDAFLAARQQNLSHLQSLDEESWQRLGRHAFLGPTSLQELVNLAVQHDEVHQQQIQELLRKQADSLQD
ncbi:MAG: DinB family protein [Candidatus Promineifilaceae bacterium]|nr:DinB family protein [Candidatus Promineifilaceae bacterium]